METTFELYSQWAKPSWAPRSEVFGPVWSVLYTIIAITYGYVAYLFWNKRIPRTVLIPFVLNLCANFLFTYFQFGIQNLWLAAIDILVVWITILRSMRAIRPYRKWVSILQLPYLTWVSIATVLQLSILMMNI